MQKELTICIPVVFWEYAQKAFSSLKACVPDELYDLVIIDNSADPEVAAHLDGVEGATVIHNPYNYGVARSFNQGITVAKTKYVAIGNDDILFSAGSVESMLDFIGRHKDVDLVCPFVSTWYEIADWQEFAPIAALIREKYKGHYATAWHGAFFMTRVSFYEKVGLFDENFSKGIENGGGVAFEEDTDFANQLRVHRCPYTAIGAAYFHHFGSRDHPKIPKIHVGRALNKKYLDEKWAGVKIPFSNYYHPPELKARPLVHIHLHEEGIEIPYRWTKGVYIPNEWRIATGYY
jgi:GT2 family glycosyltransferase